MMWATGRVVLAFTVLEFARVGAAARELAILKTPRFSAAGDIRFQQNGDSLPATSMKLLAVPLEPASDWLLYALPEQRVLGVGTREAAATQLERGMSTTEELKPFTGYAPAVAPLATAARAQLPVDAVATSEGVTLRFAVTLRTQSAADPDSWLVERLGPARAAVKMAGIGIGTDDRSVFLPVDGLAPGGQLRIRYALRGADGEVLDAEFFATITAAQP